MKVTKSDYLKDRLAKHADDPEAIAHRAELDRLYKQQDDEWKQRRRETDPARMAHLIELGKQEANSRNAHHYTYGLHNYINKNDPVEYKGFRIFERIDNENTLPGPPHVDLRCWDVVKNDKVYTMQASINGAKKAIDHIIELGEKSFYPCDRCGTITHIDLLDGKDNGSGDYTILECQLCYGSGWAPRAVSDLETKKLI